MWKWEAEISHEGLDKYRHIRGTDKYVVEQKAAAQLRTWENMWEKKQAAERKRQEQERAAQKKEEKKSLAVEKTAEAKEALATIENTLHHTLSIDDTINWESLIDITKYPVAKPPLPNKPPPPPEPTIGFFTLLIPSIKRKKYSEWELKKLEVEAKIKKIEEKHKEVLKKWEKDKADYLKKQQIKNQRIQDKKEAYFNKNNDALIDYCEMVLSNSKYPETFPQDYYLDYNPTNKILIIDYALPNQDDVPNLQEVKYVISKNEFEESFLSA